MTFDEYVCHLYKESDDSPVNRALQENLHDLEYITTNCGFTYKFDRKAVEKLKADSRLPIISADDTFARAVTLMEWITNHTQYNGYSPLKPSTVDIILDYGFNRGFDGAINCANKAILLSSLLLLNGIFAIPIWLNNAVLDDTKPTFGHGLCHVVVHAYIPELEKWALFDPSFNTYFTDDDGKIMSLFEVADLRCTPQNITVNGYNLNGTDAFSDRYLESFLLHNLYVVSVFEGSREVFQFNWEDLYSVKPRRYAESSFGQHEKTINLSDLLKKPTWFFG